MSFSRTRGMALLKTQKEVRALTRAHSCTCCSTNISTIQEKRRLAESNRFGSGLLGGGSLRGAAGCRANGIEDSRPRPRRQTRVRETRPLARRDAPRPPARAGLEWPGGLRRSTADGRRPGRRRSDVERRGRGDRPRGARLFRRTAGRQHDRIDRNDRRSGPEGAKRSGAEPRSGEHSIVVTPARGGVRARTPRTGASVRLGLARGGCTAAQVFGQKAVVDDIAVAAGVARFHDSHSSTKAAVVQVPSRN